jgi:hypothetical protein
MKGIIFISLLFLFPVTVLKAQDENKVFEKVEQNQIQIRKPGMNIFQKRLNCLIQL